MEWEGAEGSRGLWNGGGSWVDVNELEESGRESTGLVEGRLLDRSGSGRNG